MSHFFFLYLTGYYLPFHPDQFSILKIEEGADGVGEGE